MRKIGIFCAASGNIEQRYFDAAARIGRLIGEAGDTLVYGGANLGLMECVARAVKEAGGEVTGVVPSKLEENGRVSGLIDNLIRCRNLSDRKDIIAAESDVLIALPGGVGTLDEIFHVVAATSIGYHNKRVILYNENGFYNTLLRMLEEMKEKGFLRHDPTYYIEVANSTEELIAMTTDKS
jgi:hypothetical protein